MSTYPDAGFQGQLGFQPHVFRLGQAGVAGLAENSVEHTLDLGNCGWREGPDLTVGTVTRAKDDPSDGTTIEDEVRSIGLVGHFLEVNAPQTINDIFEFEG